KRTGQPLDLMIKGKGYFPIELPNGETAYTRDGTFERSPEGEIVTLNGYKLKPGLIIPPDTVEIAINPEGEVYVREGNGQEMKAIGTIELARFANPAGMKGYGDNLFLETPASGSPQTAAPGAAGYGVIEQGALEASNVQAIVAVIELLDTQHAHA